MRPSCNRQERYQEGPPPTPPTRTSMQKETRRLLRAVRVVENLEIKKDRQNWGCDIQGSTDVMLTMKSALSPKMPGLLDREKYGCEADHPCKKAIRAAQPRKNKVFMTDLSIGSLLDATRCMCGRATGSLRHVAVKQATCNVNPCRPLPITINYCYGLRAEASPEICRQHTGRNRSKPQCRSHFHQRTTCTGLVVIAVALRGSVLKPRPCEHSAKWKAW